MPSIKPSAKLVFSDPWHCMAFGFGSGLSPKAPGTMGTLVAIPLYLLLQFLPLYAYLFVLIVGFVLGVWICGYSAKVLGEHDHPAIVWDEIVGFWITMFLVPCTWWTILLGFVLFRIFDIWKPWPIHILDKKVKGGLGIMVDDVLAAVYAWAILMVIVFFV